MHRTVMAGVSLGCLLLVSSAAFAEQGTVTEDETSTTFQTTKAFGGQPHVLVGVGAREAMGTINVYGAGMYLGQAQAAKAWQGYLDGRFAKAGLVTNGAPNFQKISTSPQGRHFMVYGNMPRAIEMAFVRNVTDEQISGAYNESWDRVSLDRGQAGAALEQFMAAVNHPMQSGQRMSISSRGNNIVVTMPGGTTRIQGNRALVVGIWKIWFGDPPLQRRLRDGMMSMLTNVHALLTTGG